MTMPPPGSAMGGIHESGSFVSRLSAEAHAAQEDSGGGGAGNEGVHHQIARMHQPVKIIHKDHDAVTAFCINKVRPVNLHLI